MRFILLVICIICALGCRERESSILFDASSPLATFPCEEGDPVSFSFAALGREPDPTVVYSGTDAERLAVPSAAFQLQLDICYVESSDDFKLYRIIFIDHQGQSIFPGGGRFEGFADGVLRGNWADLRIASSVTVHGPDGASVRGVELRGWSDTEGSFVTGTRRGRYGLTSMKLITGTLEVGAVLGNLACSPGETQKDMEYAFATAQIEATACIFDNGDQTTGFRYVRVEVVDNSPELRPEQRQPQVIEETAVAEQIEAHFTHHNMYDWAAFVFPHAAYRWGRVEGNLGCSVRYNGSGLTRISCPESRLFLPYFFP